MSKKRVWDDTLEWLVSERLHSPISARELGERRGMSSAAALQLLRRLRGWGYVRLDSFANSGQSGRPAHFFGVTQKGVSRMKWKRRKESPDDRS